MAAPRIAVVDDDAEVVKFLQILLRLSGYDHLICRVGRLAPPIIREEQPALVITDLSLESPEAGWDLIHELRANESTAHIPVVICSAQAKLADKAEQHQLDNYAVLRKPFAPQELLDAVAQLLAA